MTLDAFLLHFCLVFSIATLGVLYLEDVSRRHPRLLAVAMPAVGHACATVAVVSWFDALSVSLVASMLGFFITGVFMVVLRSFSVTGRFLIAAQLTMSAVALVWGLHYLWTIDVSTTTRVLMLSTLPLMILTLPFGLLALIPQWEVLTRQRWARPRAALPSESRTHYPKVSLHVPICSEPPDVVLDTLKALAAQDYPNFEVLVIDNNTKDDALWRPVERWCAADKRFQFFHLEQCPGAKAGALNYVQQFMAGDATVIGLIDSDYQARPSFLSALIGHFDNPTVGFVQTPHDYRDWHHSLYQRMCYWEYRSFFAICVPTWNERGAAITVGTMSLIRRAALEEAGGWSEWCLTEDSELAPRIHSLGYTSVYVQESFGRGLIPERFRGYAKQRRRWTYGPIQELRAHLRMFLPRVIGKRTALTAGQKLFHLHHDLDPLLTGVGLLLTPIGLLTTASMLIHHERPSLPWVAIVAGLCVAVSSQIMSWRVYRVAMGCSLLDVFYAGFAKSALAHSIAISALRALVALPLSWERTDKFKARGEGARRALFDTRIELMLGCLFIAIGLAALNSAPQGLLLLLVLGIALQGIGYLVAPGVALLAEWELRRATPVGATCEPVGARRERIGPVGALTESTRGA